jgi:ketosteroid isomerase-like protein
MSEARRGTAERAAAAASPAQPAVVRYEKDDVRVVRHGDTAVTTYRFGVTVRADDQEVTRRYRTTNVWIRRGGDWQVVAAHTAGLG